MEMSEKRVDQQEGIELSYPSVAEMERFAKRIRLSPVPSYEDSYGALARGRTRLLFALDHFVKCSSNFAQDERVAKRGGRE